MNKKLAAVGVPKQKEVGMLKSLWKGKGVPVFIGAVTGVLIALLLMSAGVARAGFRVENRADLIYYTSEQLKISYTGFDTAWLVVLYGPKMTIAKWVKNEVTGETNPDFAHVSRGESVTFHLYSQNDDPGDTDAWGVTITDTFSMLAAVSPGTMTATVGSDTVTKTFTFVLGSADCDSNAECAPPDSVSYSTDGSVWTGWQDYPTGIATLNGLTTITGIRWYWNHIASKVVWDDATNTNISSGRQYMIHLWYSILRNDN